LAVGCIKKLFFGELTQVTHDIFDLDFVGGLGLLSDGGAGFDLRYNGDAGVELEFGLNVVEEANFLHKVGGDAGDSVLIQVKVDLFELKGDLLAEHGGISF
jgi:hypothetical protein